LARAPDERANKAYELYQQGLKLVEIASQLNVPEGTVRSWKNRYKWDNATLQKSKRNVAKRNKGGQPGNKNAVGHGAPARNDNAVKHGLFEKYLPQETLDIVKCMSLNPLDILWDQIQIAYAAIVRAQQISYVRDKEDNTIIKSGYKDGNVIGEDFLVQTAIDKQSKFMQAQARAQSELRALIKQYDEMLHKNWELATEEQKARIEVMKAKANIGGNEPTEDDGFLDALSGKVDEIWQEE
jgi:phage terminase small subunit